MKKVLLILAVLIFGNFAFAEDVVLSGGVTFDWVNMEKYKELEEKASSIENYKNIIFANQEDIGYKKKRV